jgi:hypothetical protein
MSITASRIPQETREIVAGMFNGFCGCTPDCTERASEIHHIVPNTKSNVKKFPLFINSPFNLIPVSRECHDTKNIRTITLKQAQIYESYLQKRELYKKP